MKIQSISIDSHKSFHSVDISELHPTYNVIVGKNNTGKSALLDVLNLRFSASPHRTQETKPSAGGKVHGKPKIEVGLDLANSQVMSVIQSSGNELILPAPRVTNDRNRFLAGLCQELLELVGPVDGSNQLQVEMGPALSDVHSDNPFGLYTGAHRRKVAKFKWETDRFTPMPDQGQYVDTFFLSLMQDCVKRVYCFKPLRTINHRSSFASSDQLQPDASNLASVIGVLRENSGAFRRFNKAVRRVFPDIHEVNTLSSDGSNLEIVVWPVDPSNERKDLAIPLMDCGTGIGQAIAMIYVLITATEPTVFLIDEPQSFLHPGALHRLLDIIKEHSIHQYFIATHAPSIISSLQPEGIIVLENENGKTQVEVLERGRLTRIDRVLNAVEADRYDMFGADNVLWVEGQTEVEAFKVILDRLVPGRFGALHIASIVHTGDLDSKKKKNVELVIKVYREMSRGGNVVIPPAIGMVLDDEGRSETDKNDLLRMAKSGENPIALRFLPRRMFESYLMNPAAIAFVIANESDFTGAAPSEAEVAKSLKKTAASQDGEDSAGILKSYFAQSKIPYDKTVHSLALTKWLADNAPEDLSDIVDLLTELTAPASNSPDD
jgi:hypothetical protein